LAAVVIILYTASITYGICFFIDKTLGINITLLEESKGLDKIQHGEAVYNLQDTDGEEIEGDEGTYFLNLIAEGNLTDVKYFYKKHFKIDFKDFYLRNGLHVAASKG